MTDVANLIRLTETNGSVIWISVRAITFVRHLNDGSEVGLERAAFSVTEKPDEILQRMVEAVV